MAIQTIIINDIIPMGAVRVTRLQARYGGNKAYEKYRSYKKEIAAIAEIQKIEVVPTSKPITIKEALFFMPIPKSRLKVNKDGDPHLVKPDLDNLLKGLKDSLNGVLWEDDKTVWQYSGNICKIYSENPGIILTIEY